MWAWNNVIQDYLLLGCWCLLMAAGTRHSQEVLDYTVLVRSHAFRAALAVKIKTRAIMPLFLSTRLRNWSKFCYSNTVLLLWDCDYDFRLLRAEMTDHSWHRDTAVQLRSVWLHLPLSNFMRVERRIQHPSLRGSKYHLAWAAVPWQARLWGCGWS